jgi:PAS domain S-box-containing protein
LIDWLKRIFNVKRKTYVSTISRTVIDNAFVAIVIIDSKGNVIEWNPQAVNLFGWSYEEAINNKATNLIIPNRFHSKHSLGIKQFLQYGKSDIIGKEVNLTVKHKDGYEFTVAVRLNHVVSKGENLFVALISDKSIEKKVKEQQLEYSAQLNGRIKTLMSVIQAMIKQTLVTADPEEVGSLLARLFVMDKAINILYQTNWRYANLYSLIYDTTYIYGTSKQFILNGDTDFQLKGDSAISFALIIHELSANSIKHGALSKDSEGKVNVSWEIKDNQLIWHWIESGGPKVVTPKELGFGMQFIKRAFTGQGTTIIEYLPDGLSCTIVLRLDDKAR